MSTNTQTYKGIKIVSPTPEGEAGKALNDNFRYIGDQLELFGEIDHTHGNKSILDAITVAGSGEIISAAERAQIATNQSDIAGKAEASHSHSASDIASGTLADARIAASNVTQHESALTITENQVSDLGSYITQLADDTTPELSAHLSAEFNNIVNLDAISIGGIDVSYPLVIEHDNAGVMISGAGESAGNADLILKSGDQGTATITLGISSAAEAAISFDNTTDILVFNVDGTDILKLTDSEIDASNNKVINLANGTASADAVNFGQLQTLYRKFTQVVFTAQGNVPPASNPAAYIVRNGHAALAFDDSTDESAVFQGVLPATYTGNGLTVDIYWMAESATSGVVYWSVAIERGLGVDLDSDSFSGENVTGSVPQATNGQAKLASIVFTDGGDMDSLAAGEPFRLRITRDADDAIDTMAGDAQLLVVKVRETE